jgi:hypothetical protein
MAQIQAKYSFTSSGDADTSGTVSTAPAESRTEEDAEDANTLGAMAMQAMLSGDMAKYEELNQRLEKKQAAVAAALDKSKAAATAPTLSQHGQQVKVLEEINAAGRSHSLLESVQTTSVKTKGKHTKGTVNAVPGRGKKVEGFYEDDEVNLGDLMRRERIEGVQDYDSNFANHILKKGSKFKMLDAEDDEAYALGWFEDSSKKVDDRQRAERQMRQRMSDKGRVQVNLDLCTRCMESKRFGRRDALISQSEHAYLCAEGFNQSILPGQVFIAPREHCSAITDVDEDVWMELRNYQKCLIRYFDAQEPAKAVIFVESVVQRVSREKALMGGGPHAAIIAYPVDLEIFSDARLYWKKALEESECEFTTQHKRVIATDGKGSIRKAVPQGFAYVHVDFSLSGGYAHIVEDSSEFPRDFAQHTMAGMCGLTILDRAYTNRDVYKNACLALRKNFCSSFDWTQSTK